MSQPLEVVRPGGGGLAHYDPDRGLKTIAVAETAEKYFRRAKDASKLLAAVALKLGEQRAFVLWWDGTERRGRKVADSATFLDGLGIDKFTLHRWRVRLKDDRTFQATLEAAQARCVKFCEAYRGGLPENSRSLGTGETEWYTPAEYVEAARGVLGEIDLDPASSDVAQRTVKATRYFTKADDGLRQEWRGRVWLNPPYAQPHILHFVEKLVGEYAAGRTTEAVLLTHNFTDTAWFHRAASRCSAACFTRGRIGFVGPHGNGCAPTQGQCFHYFGPRLGRFWARFAEIGLIMAPLAPKAHA